LRLNASQFDAILKAQGRAAAVSAALASGVTVTGNRLNTFGGSRFITSPNLNTGLSQGLSPFKTGKTGSFSNLNR
ncbi:unnamed protein product, partial [marine sediment metagenome]